MKGGFLYIDKPTGMTSYDVIRRLKRLLPKGIKIGHAGTLDPLATGLLIIGVGRDATKQFATMLKFDKQYEVTALFGKKYDTGDVTGNIIEEQDTTNLTKEAIEKILPHFSGCIEQIPPMYSALKKDGKKLYELAREGKEVERVARKITIHSLTLETFRNPRAAFQVSCSSGTYIRTLVEDIGNALGVGATVEVLRRTKIGRISIQEAKDLALFKSEKDIEKALSQDRD